MGDWLEMFRARKLQGSPAANLPRKRGMPGPKAHHSGADQSSHKKTAAPSGSQPSGNAVSTIYGPESLAGVEMGTVAYSPSTLKHRAESKCTSWMAADLPAWAFVEDVFFCYFRDVPSMVQQDAGQHIHDYCVTNNQYRV